MSGRDGWRVAELISLSQQVHGDRAADESVAACRMFVDDAESLAQARRSTTISSSWAILSKKPGISIRNITSTLDWQYEDYRNIILISMRRTSIASAVSDESHGLFMPDIPRRWLPASGRPAT